MSLGRFLTKRKPLFIGVFFLIIGNVFRVDAVLLSLTSPEYTASELGVAQGNQLKVINLLPNGPIELYNYDFADNNKASYRKLKNCSKLRHVFNFSKLT